MIRERLNPLTITDSHDMQLNYHLSRYKKASYFVKEKGRILDVASGTGYGTKILKMEHVDSVVIGIDNSKEALQIAEKHYNHDGIFYILADAETFWTPYKFGTLVCLETLEHLKNPIKFLDNIVNYLGDNAHVVISAPVTEKAGENPFHHYTFNRIEFRDLFGKYFVIVDEFDQIDYLTLMGIRENE